VTRPRSLSRARSSTTVGSEPGLNDSRRTPFPFLEKRDACDNDRAVVDSIDGGWRHQDVITLCHAKHGEIVRAGLHNEAAGLPAQAAIDREVHLDGAATSASIGDLVVTRHGDRFGTEVHPQNLHTAGTGGIPLQEPLVGQRL